MDEIRLEGLRLLGTHGVLAEEKTRRQPFEIDINVAVDLLDASTSDDLAETVDYGEIVAVTATVVESEHFALLERLAGRICEVVLGLDPRISSVTVTLRKVRPPVPHDLASAAVRLIRGRRS